MTEPARIREYFESTRWGASRGSAFLGRERTLALHQIAEEIAKPHSELRICDVGCGDGTELVHWRDAGVPEGLLAGTELVPERARRASAAVPSADVRLVHDDRLPFADDAFDLCSASLVLSSIKDQTIRVDLLREMARVTAPGGAVVVYDFRVRKPWNRNVAAVTTRELTRAWRAPDRVIRAGPLLPALRLALRLPPRLARIAIRPLPRTHRLWVWRMPGAADEADR